MALHAGLPLDLDRSAGLDSLAGSLDCFLLIHMILLVCFPSHLCQQILPCPLLPLGLPVLQAGL